jgi:hypothetical protein
MGIYFFVGILVAGILWGGIEAIRHAESRLAKAVALLSTGVVASALPAFLAMALHQSAALAVVVSLSTAVSLMAGTLVSRNKI